jgi:ribosomal protein L13E
MSWYENAARDPSVGPIVPQGKAVVRASGYSLVELQRAGLTVADAERLRIPIDRKRQCMIGANVMQLRLLACA